MPHADPSVRAAYHRGYDRRWKAEMRARYRAGGLCARCGRAPVVRFATCLDCREMAMRSYRRKRRLAPCVVCGTGCGPGKTGLCLRCCAKRAARLRWRPEAA